jgi:hypothetical protein
MPTLAQPRENTAHLLSVLKVRTAGNPNIIPSEEACEDNIRTLHDLSEFDYFVVDYRSQIQISTWLRCTSLHKVLARLTRTHHAQEGRLTSH